MPQINLGTVANDGTGSPLRTGGQLINQYGLLGDKTINAAFYKTASITNEAAITLAIVAAALLGTGAAVWVPASMLPYNASLVTFNTAVRMVREGGDPDEFDVEAYGAAANFAQSDASCTAGIQAAIDAQNAAGRGVVRFPSATYNITTIKYYSGTILRGSGIRGTLNVNGTQLFQGSFAGPMVQPNAPGSVTSGFSFEDIAFSSFGNTNNTGGIDLTNTFGFNLTDVMVTGAAVYSIKIVGGPTAGNSGFGHFTRVQVINFQAGTYGWIISSSVNDQPDGLTFTDCYSTSTLGTWIRYQCNTHATAGSNSWKGCSFECVGGSAAVDLTYDATGGGMNTFTDCRFENTGSGGIQVTLNGQNISPAACFTNCVWAPGAGGLTWIDNGPVLSPRIVNSLGDASQALLTRYTQAIQTRAVALVSGTTPTLDAKFGTYFTLAILSNIAVVIAVPLNPPTTGFSQELVIAMRNASGGALTTPPTFNTGANGFKFSAVTNPANGTQVVYHFRWDPVQSFWYEVGTHLAAGI